MNGVSDVSNVSDDSNISEISRTEGDDTEEPLGDNAALKDVTADDTMTRTPTNCDKSRQSTAGQKEGGSDCNLELKDVLNSELPKVMEVTNSFEGLADAGNDERGDAGYDTRKLATKTSLGNRSNLDAIATSKVGHVGDCVRDGDEDSLADQKKLKTKGVAPDAIRIINPIDRIVSSIIKYEYLPQILVKAGLERSEPLQNELAKESCESPEAGLNKTEGDCPTEPFEDTPTQDDITAADDLEEVYN